MKKEDKNIYHPISKLPFISKLIKKVMTRRIEVHLEDNELNDNYQCAYRRFHSTEIALSKVHSDVAGALGE